MADVGLEFNSDSFKVFNTTLKEFDKIAKKVDTKLNTMAVSVGNLLTAASPANVRNFDTFQNSFSHFVNVSRQLSATSFNRIQVSISQLLKATSSYGVLQFEQFRVVFNKFAQDMNVLSFGDIMTAANSIKNFFKALEGFKPTGATKVIFELQYFFEELNKIIKSLAKAGGGRIDVFNKTVISIRTIVKSFADMGTLKLNKQKVIEVLDFLRRFVFGKANFGGIVSSIKRIGKIDANSVDAFSKTGQAIANLIRGLNEIAEVKFNKEAVVQGLDFIRRFLFGGKFSSLFGRGGIAAIIKRMGNINSNQVKNFSRTMNALASMIKAVKDLDKLVLGDNSVKNINKNIDAITKIFGKFKGGVMFGAGGGSGGGSAQSGGMVSFLKNIVVGIGSFNLRFDREIDFTRRAFGEAGSVYGKFFRELIGLVPFGDRGFRLMGNVFLTGGRTLNNAMKTSLKIFGGVTEKFLHIFKFPGMPTRAKRNVDEAFNKVERNFKNSVGRTNSRLQNIIDGGFKLAFGSIALRITEGLGQLLNPANLMNSFIEFESAFTGVIKTLDTSGMSDTEAAQFIADLAEDVRSMSTEEGGVLSGLENAAVSIAGIMESAGQLGIARENLQAFTETVGAMTLATNLSADSAADFFGQFGAITQSEDYDRIGATMVGLGNNFAATESQIADFALRLGGAGTIAGLTEAEILGVGAAMASVGINAEAGGTAMTQVFNEMAKAAASAEGSTITGSQYIAQQNRNLENIAAQRQEALENLEAARDRLSRASTLSSQESAGDAVQKYEAELAKLDGIITNTNNNIANTSANATISINNSSKELQTYARIAGVSAEEFAEKWNTDATGALDLFIQGVGKLENAERIAVLDELGLDSVRVADTLSRLAASGTNLTDALVIANREWESNTALMSEAEKRAATTRSAINRMKNNFFDLKVTVGEILQPVFMGFINTLTRGISGFHEWLKLNKEGIQEVFPKIINFFVVLRDKFNLFFTLFEAFPLKTFTIALQDMSRAFRMLFSGDAEMAAYTFGTFFNNIKEGLTEIANIFKFSFFGLVGEGSNPIMDFINKLFTDVQNHDWGEAITSIKNAILGIFTSAFSTLGFGTEGRFGFASEEIAESARQSIIDAGKPENFTKAVNRFVTGLRLAFYDISEGDFTGVKNFLETHISQIVRSAITIAIGLVFGFPIGAALSVANLIVSAIQSDMLGIRGLLEQSTIGQSIVAFADGLNAEIEKAFALVFGGDSGGMGETVQASIEDGLFLTATPLAGSEGNFIQKLFEQLFTLDIAGNEGIQAFIQGLKDFATEITNILTLIDIEKLEMFVLGISQAITDLAKGAFAIGVFLLQTFVMPLATNFAESLETFINSIDPEDVKGFVITIGIIKALFLAPAILHLAGVFAILGGVSKSIGDFGAALGDLFGAIGLLLEGDYGGALEKIGDAVEHLWNGIKNFIEGAVQPFVDLINKLLEVAGVDFQLISVEQAFQTLEMVAQGVLFNIMRWVEDMGYKIAYQLNDIKLRGLQALKDTGLATGDQLMQLDEATIERNAFNAVSSIQDAVFRAANRRDGLDLSAAISFENWDGSTFTGSIEEALSNPEIANRLSGTTKTLLLNAAKNALNSGDGKEIADALNIFKALGEIPPETSMSSAQEIVATSLAEYKRLIEMEYDNVVLELPTLQQLLASASFDQALGGGEARFQIPEGMGVEFAQQFNAGLTAVFESNPFDLAAIFNTNTMLNQNSEILAKAGVDMAAALRESVANAFTTGLEATGDADWAAGSVIDEFLPLLNLSGSQEEIQAQFNEQLGLLTQNLNAEDALAIGHALEIKLEEIVLAGTGATIDLQVDEEAINAAGAEAMKQNGLDVIGGLLAGVGEMLGIDTLSIEAEKVFTSFNDAFKSAAGIASPSQVFIDNGKALVDGLNQGVTEQMPIYQQTMTMMGDEITKFKDHTNVQIEEFKTILTGIPLAILDTGLQFTNAVMIWAVQGLVFGFILDGIALKIAGVADQLSNLAAFLGLVGGSLGSLALPGGSGGEDDGLAKGGSVSRGKIYEVLEDNLPFEMFKTKGKTYFISNSDGMMLSPLTANAIGAGNVSNSTTNNTSGDVVMNFNINSNDPEEIVRVAKREFTNMRQEEAKNQKRNEKRSGYYGV